MSQAMPEPSEEVREEYINGNLTDEELQEYMDNEYMDTLDAWWRERLMTVIVENADEHQ